MFPSCSLLYNNWERIPISITTRFKLRCTQQIGLWQMSLVHLQVRKNILRGNAFSSKFSTMVDTKALNLTLYCKAIRFRIDATKVKVISLKSFGYEMDYHMRVDEKMRLMDTICSTEFSFAIF